jgi:hypothetical protein
MNYFDSYITIQRNIQNYQELDKILKLDISGGLMGRKFDC